MADSVKLEIKGLEHMTARLRALATVAPKAAGAALYREGERIMAEAKELVPVDMGTLRNSGHVMPPQQTANGIEVILGFGGPATGKTQDGVGYAVWVHEGIGPAVGRPAFMPPVEPIAEWAVRHGMDESAGFPIARAIGERGIEPTKYLERPLLAAVQGFAERVAADTEEELKRAAG